MENANAVQWGTDSISFPVTSQIMKLQAKLLEFHGYCH